MNSFTAFSGTAVNSVRGLAFVFLTAFLSACGGGGGSTSTPPPPTVTPATVTIVSVAPNGTTAINQPVSTTPILNFTVANGSYLSHTADWKCGGNPVTNTPVVVGTTSGTITLTSATSLLLGQSCQVNWAVSGTPTGNNAAQVTQTFSVKTTMSYTDKVYTLYVGGYPYAVTKTGVTKVVNKTSFTTGFFPLFNCALYEVPIETGIIPLQCTVASDNIRRMFYINPLTEELFQYTGSFAFDSTKLHDVGFGTATPYGINVGHSGEYAEVADGIYWGPVRSDQKLRFSPKVANGYDFNTVTIIATGTGPDFFKFLFKYSF